jgi:hypothetical protein
VQAAIQSPHWCRRGEIEQRDLCPGHPRQPCDSPAVPA